MKDIPSGRGVRAKRDPAGDLLGPTSEIGRKLKEYYDDLVKPDVPDRFGDLLAKLEQAEKQGANPDEGKG